MKQKGYTKHHRKPKSLEGSDRPENISYVKSAEHFAWHALFANLPPEEIVRRINEVWLDPEFKIILERQAPPG